MQKCVKPVFNLSYGVEENNSNIHNNKKFLLGPFLIEFTYLVEIKKC